MKTTKTALVLTVIGLSLAATANAGQVSGLDKSTATQLCVTAANGSKVAMLHEIKGSGWSSNFVQDNVRCNGESIGNFVAKHGSDGVKYMLPANANVEIIELSQVKGLSGNVQVSK